MATIEVRYSQIVPGIYHKYLVYTPNVGTPQYARGGPTGPIPSPPYMVDPNSPAIDWGDIRTDYGDYDPTSRDWDPEFDDPRETIIEGDDLSDIWDDITRTMDDIEQEGHQYDPLGDNSNSTADEALRRNGLPEPTQDGAGENMSPGSGRELDPPDRHELPPADEPSWWPPSIPFPPFDPLVVDLDQDGVELISLSASTAHFDFDGNNFQEKTGWVSADDAFIVHDDNNDGVVNGVSELFGNPALDGFAALAAFDSNHDGRVDSGDTNFSTLKLWRDLDQDGESDIGELFALSTYGIASVNISASAVNSVVEGNRVIFSGSAETAGGGSAEVNAVLFAVDHTTSEWIPPANFEPDEEALLLPTLHGYGTLPNLVYSMSLDSTLLEAGDTFVRSLPDLSGSTIYNNFIDLLFRWADVGGVSQSERGPNIDGRKVAFLEAFFGAELEDVNGGSLIGTRYAAELERSFSTISDVLLTRYLVQSGYALVINLGESLDSSHPIFQLGHLTYQAFDDSIAGDVGRTIDWLAHKAPAESGEKLAYFDISITALRGLTHEYFGGDSERFKAFVFDRLVAQGEGDAALIEYLGLVIDHRAVSEGTDSNETLIGTQSPDILNGQKGDDDLLGGQGNDTFIYCRGDGNDTITEIDVGGSLDRLLLVGVDPEDVTLTFSGIDVTLVIAESAPGAGDGGSILLKQQLDEYIQRGVEQIVFADATVWSADDLRAKVIALQQTSGNDTIVGFDNADTIEGGAGDDVINGGRQNDTYLYSRGDGNDTITEIDVGGSLDRLLLVGVDPEDVTLTFSGIDVTLVIAESAPGAGDGGSILLKQQLDEYIQRGVEQIVFADATVWSADDLRAKVIALQQTSGNDTIVGFDNADTIEGGAGDDVINGGRQNDTYLYSRGDGNDTITEIDVGGSLDRLLLVGVDPEDVTLTFSGIDVTLVIAESAPGAGDGGSILLKQQLDEYIQRGVEQIVFADATVWSADDLRAKVIALQQTSGNDTIVGFDNADTIEGGAGDDVINGGRQNDTYLYSRGDGNDTITEIDVGGSLDRLLLVGVDPEDVTLTFSGIDVTLVIAESAPGAGDGGSILLKQQLDEYIQRGVEQIVFADATVWSADDLRAKVIALQQTSGNDTIVGFDNADTIEGGAGDDVINGGRQNDTYLYSRGDGNDTITEIDVGGALDKVVFADIDPEDVTLTFSGIDVTLVIAESAPGAGDGGSILLKQQLDEYIQRGVEQIVFADATVWSADDLRAKVIALQQTSGNDTIVGFDNADTIEGGAGDDVINGGRQNDTYLYSRGDGNDTITEIDVGGSLDRLLLVGVDPEDVTLTFSGIDVTLVIAESAPGAGDGGSILLKQQLDEYIQRGVEQIVFADATVWSADDLRAKVIALQQTSGNDTIVGFDNADTIEGGAGDDVINGGRQNDTYLYSRGDGNDTITEIDVGGALDKVVFADIDPEDISVVTIGNDVMIVVRETLPGAGDGGSILLKDQVAAYIQRGVEEIHFSDATVWNRTTLLARAVATGTASADVIAGTAFNDYIDGGAGDDTLSGGDGDDVLIGGAGADAMNGGAGSDTASYATASTGVYVHMMDDTWNTGDAVGDTFASIENLIGSDHDDTLIATDEANIVSGGAGADTLLGLLGDDLLLGSAGNDLLHGGEGADFLDGGEGNDELFGDEGNDELHGRAGDDYVVAGDGNDLLYGEDGDDELHGSDGDDQIHGGDGADALFGDDGDDKLDGGAGDDFILTGAGDDTIVFRPGYGSDFIGDFTAGANTDDVIEIGGFNIADFAELQGLMSEWGGNTFITFSDGSELAIEGVTNAQLHSDDFRFAA